MIELRHIRKEYEIATPLKDVNVTINKGDVISIIGPSGTGKSTLIRMINLLEYPTSGQIFVDGEEITAKGYDINKVRKKIGMVFQSFNLFSHLTIIENIMKPQIDLLKRERQEAYDKAINLLEIVGLKDKALQYPDQLSGGQKQRIAICRTLAMDPDVILLDEPTSALDPTMVNEVQEVINDLAKRGHTMMIVTHEMNFARKISNRVFYMDQGGVYEDGTPEEIFDNPKRERTKVFIRQLKVLAIDINSKDFDFMSVISQINDYGLKNGISPRMYNRIYSVFEEMSKEIILPVLDNPKLKVIIEYSRKDNEVMMNMRYNGKHFNPSDSDNELSMRIIQNSIKTITHTTIEDGDYTNNVTITFKNED